MLPSPSITVALWMINFNRQKMAREGLSISEKEERKIENYGLLCAYMFPGLYWHSKMSADPFHMNRPVSHLVHKPRTRQ